MTTGPRVCAHRQVYLLDSFYTVKVFIIIVGIALECFTTHDVFVVLVFQTFSDDGRETGRSDVGYKLEFHKIQKKKITKMACRK